MSKILISIKNRWTGSIIFEYEKENNTPKETVEELLKANVDKTIRDVDLSHMDLNNISFVGSRFVGSRFVGSTFDGSAFDGSAFVGSRFVGSTFDGSAFDGSTFVGSRFVGSRFVGSRFVGSTFDGSAFDGSTFDGSAFDGSAFVGSRFVGSRFVGSRFVGSRFVGSRFDDATIQNIIKDGQLKMFDSYKNCLWATLLKAKNEIAGLKLALTEGRVDGSKYEGDCACLKGTIANLKKCSYNSIPGMLPDSDAPSEVWFLMISPGMTPENSEIVKLTLSWIEEFEMYLNA